MPKNIDMNGSEKTGKRSASASLVSFLIGKLTKHFKIWSFALFLKVVAVIIFIGILTAIILLPILLLLTLKDYPAKIAERTGVIIRIVIDEFGGKSVQISRLPGFTTESISAYGYLVDSTSENKNTQLNALKSLLDSKTASIKSSIGLNDMFGTYKQSLSAKLMENLFFKEDSNQTFEEVKKSLENLYKVKYNRKNSDYFILDYIENKGYYSSFFKQELESEILTKTKSSKSTFVDLKNGRYNGLGYYVTASGSGSKSSFISIASRDQVSSTKGGKIVEFKINSPTIDTPKLLSFFYTKATIEDYLKVNGQNLNEYSGNDISYLVKSEGDDGLVGTTLNSDKLEDLKGILRTSEDAFVKSFYLANKNNFVVNGEVLSEDLGLQISRRVIEKRYSFYRNNILENGIIFSLSVFMKVSEKGTDYDSCKITQLYGASNVSVGGGYPGGLHNGYDIVFEQGGSRSVKLRAMFDGKVVISRNGNAVGNQVVIKGNTSIKTQDGKTVSPIVEYLHLSEAFVSEGQNVYAGQIIGIQGNTGNSAGAHLHISGYLSGISEGCSGNLNSTHGYACAVMFSQFFRAFNYENIFQGFGCSMAVGAGHGSNW